MTLERAIQAEFGASPHMIAYVGGTAGVEAVLPFVFYDRAFAWLNQHFGQAIEKQAWHPSHCGVPVMRWVLPELNGAEQHINLIRQPKLHQVIISFWPETGQKEIN